jgi:hypothetical protein
VGYSNLEDLVAGVAILVLKPNGHEIGSAAAVAATLGPKANRVVAN